MARYTGSFIVGFNGEEIDKILLANLAESSLKLIHQKGNFLMFREEFGEISLNLLVTVEITWEQQTNGEFNFNLLAHNDELPVHEDNHCRQVMENLATLFLNETQWRVWEWIII